VQSISYLTSCNLIKSNLYVTNYTATDIRVETSDIPLLKLNVSPFPFAQVFPK